MEKLLHLSDHEILINFTPNTKCRTTIRLQSLHPTSPIAFKIQTSSPHKFLVNPPSGLLPPLSSSSFQIILKPLPHPPSSFPRSPSDRFLLKFSPASDLLPVNSPDSTHSDIANHWFARIDSFPIQIYEIKLKVYFVGNFLLQHAVSTGDLQSVRGIVKKQPSIVADLDDRDAESLYRAAERYGDVAKVLIGAGMRIGGELRWEGMHAAAACDRAGEIGERVRGGEGVEGRDREGRTPLIVAAGKGNVRSVGVLVGAGANVDARSRDGRTAVYRAAANGDRAVVEMLVAAGADPTIGDVEHCRSAIGVARDKGHVSNFKKLI